MPIRRIYIFLLCLSLTSSIARAEVCDDILTVAEVAKIRQSIVEGSQNYGNRFPLRKISLLRGNEADLLSKTAGRTGHVFYLASGADVFRPIMDFPAADHIHLLDRLSGWGSSDLEVIFSIKHRLEELFENVEVSDLGFLEQHPAFGGLSAIRSQTGSEDFLKKLELRAQWAKKPIVFTAQRLRGQDLDHPRQFYLHYLDWNHSEDFDAAFETLGTAPLLGVMQMGLTGTPSAKDLNRLLDRLDPDGYYIDEFTGYSFLEWMSNENSFERVGTEFGQFLERELEVKQTPVTTEHNRPTIVYLLRKKR